MNLLDDSLSTDRAEAGGLTHEMVQRFIALADYARRADCMGILFTCSAFEAAGAYRFSEVHPAVLQQWLARFSTVEGRPLRTSPSYKTETARSWQ